MDETAEERKDKAILRLRRIEGQVRGIQKMLQDGRQCEEVLTQLMAVRSSIDQVGVLLMESHIEDCLFQDLAAADPARLRELKETLKTWTRFGLLPGASSPLGEP